MAGAVALAGAVAKGKLLKRLAGLVAMLLGATLVALFLLGMTAATVLSSPETEQRPGVVVGGWTHPLGVEFIWDTYDNSSHSLGAVDFPIGAGSPVYAAASGTAMHAGWLGTYGLAVTLLHADGTATHYAHLSALTVSPRESVTVGQLIGLVGATGGDWGPHLHFETRATLERSTGMGAYGFMAQRGIHLGTCYGGPCHLAGY